MKAQNEGALRALMMLLRRGQMTARQIAAAMHCSKLTAYHRIESLRSRDIPIKKRRVRDGIRGPRAVGYSIGP